MENKKFAVILSGCGNKDGSEIHESVLTLLAIDRYKHAYQCFAPNINQYRSLNFITNNPLNEKRNVLVESARIARSDIKPLSDFNSSEYDILIIPGGGGVGYNLCTYHLDGLDMQVNGDVSRAILSMHAEHKPIGALCLSPVILAKLIPGVNVTFGNDQKMNDLFNKIGTKTTNSDANSVIIDNFNKIVTTPCYMVKASINEISIGIEKCVSSLINLSV